MTKKDKITYKTLTAVAVVTTALLSMSCATDLAFLEGDEVPIRLSVGCQEMTRGTSGQSSQETAFDEGALINVTITTSDATPVSICNGAIFTASAPSGGTNTLTPPDETRPPYYPNGDKTVTIKAFYPSTVNTGTTSFAVQTDQTTVSTTDETIDTYKKSDLMTATVTGQVKTSNDVNLQFQHRMAKITISATATDGLTIQSINLANVQTTASYASATDSWSGSGSTGTITVAKDGTAATLSGVALFPAQTIEGKTFIQVVTNKGTANYAVISKAFQGGYDYTANLEVGLQNLTMTAAITDWSAATGTATITKVNKYGMTIDAISQELTYNGEEKEPSVVVSYVASGGSKTPLTIDTDYTLQYYNNRDAGTAMVVAIGKGTTSSNTGAAVQTFVIGQAESSVSFVDGLTVNKEFENNSSFTNHLIGNYDGNITWTSNNTSIADVDGDGKVTIIAPGVATIKVATDGSGNYTSASLQYTLNISKRSTENHMVISSLGTFDSTYSGEAKEPVPVVYDGTNRLYDNQGCYTVSYANNINAGTGTVTITGMGVYDATSVSQPFTINKTQDVISISETSHTIGIGETYTIEASATYGSLSYSSNDVAVASVSSSGVVTGLKEGSTTITVSGNAGTNYTQAASKNITITVEKLETKFTTVGTNTYTCPATATYTFELYGAGGGDYSSGTGGKGGHVKASKQLVKGTVVTIIVGGKGATFADTTQPGGSNGGGTPGANGGAGGGGATDIRIGGTETSNRVLVAGGGGGASGRRYNGRNAGDGSSGNGDLYQGANCTYDIGGGGGGGYYGGKMGFTYGNFWGGGGYGGSNYIDSSWTSLSIGTSSNTDNGSVVVTYQYE